MDNLLLQSRLNLPIVTGNPTAAQPNSAPKTGKATFRQVLDEQVAKTGTLSFSGHAAARVQERGIDLNSSSLERLSEGVRIAREKGLDNTLILVDSTAFIVSVKNSKVITTLGGAELKGNAITNINGTVIV
ncbi:MAG: flagellar protein [Anaerotruncus sp.]|nr:flagellar protein [Anaerotruncus sp.]